MAVDYSGIQQSINQGYGAQRQQAQQQETANLQGQKEALARRQAQLGGGPSGAFISQEQQAGNQSAQRLQQANAGIDQAQAADTRNLQMTQLGQQFQTSEREAGQQFQAGQQATQIGAQEAMQQTGITAQSSLQDRQIAAQQLMQQQGISAQEAMQKVGITSQEQMQQTQEKFQQGMQEGAEQFQAQQNDATRAIQQQQFAQQMGVNWDQFQQGVKQFDQQFAEQSQVDQFNEGIASQMAGKKDFLEQLAGKLSFGNGSGVGGTIADVGKAVGIGEFL